MLGNISGAPLRWSVTFKKFVSIARKHRKMSESVYIFDLIYQTKHILTKKTFQGQHINKSTDSFQGQHINQKKYYSNHRFMII